VSTVPTLLATALEPVVSASTLAVWVPAALLAAAAQTDRPQGPAPRANRSAARSALALVVLGVALGAVQFVAAVTALAGWSSPPTAALAWPALVASLTGAALVLRGAVRPLRRLRTGRAITDDGQLRRMHAALRTAAAGGALATIAVVLGAGLKPVDGVAAPYLAPMLLVGGAVVGVHALLRSGAVSR
jgi:hypothetical protein